MGLSLDPEVKKLDPALILAKDHLPSGSLCVLVRCRTVSKVRSDFH